MKIQDLFTAVEQQNEASGKLGIQFSVAVRFTDCTDELPFSEQFNTYADFAAFVNDCYQPWAAGVILRSPIHPGYQHHHFRDGHPGDRLSYKLEPVRVE